MNITALLESLLKGDGISSVIAIVLIAVFYILVDKKIIFQTKKGAEKLDSGFKTISEEMTKSNDKIIGALLHAMETQEESRQKGYDRMIELIEKSVGRRQDEAREMHSANVDARMNVNRAIDEKLKVLHSKYRCDRFSIMEFHNNNENLQGLGFAWYDVQYEFASRGMKAHNKTNEPVYSILPIIEDISASETGVLVYGSDDIRSMHKRSSILGSYLNDELKTRTSVYCGLWNDQNALIGFAAMDYIKKEFNPELLDAADFAAECRTISELLRFDGK